MNIKKSHGIRRGLSLFLTLVMLISLLPTNLAMQLGLTKKAEAAGTSFSDDLDAQGSLRKKIVQNAAKYLGHGYSQESRSNTFPYYSFDCSSLVSRVLLDSGVIISTGYNGGGALSESNWATTNWSTNGYQYGIEQKTLSITYDGKTYTGANGGIVYCSSVAAYNSAVANAANSGKFIVLTAPQMTTEMQTPPGTILLHPYNAATDSAAHMAIVAGTITPSGYSLKSGGDGTASYWWNSYKYLNQVNTYFGNYLDTYAQRSNSPEHYAFMGGGDRTGVLNAIKSVDSSVTSLPSWLDTSTQHLNGYNSRQNFWTIWRTDRAAGNPNAAMSYNGYYGIGSTTWRIEAGSPTYGVGLTNKIDGKGAYPYAYAITMITGDYYYGLNAQKFTSDGTMDFPGPNGANGTYKNPVVGNSGVGLGGGKATFSVYTSISSNGTLSGAVVTNKEIDTPRGGDNSISGNPGGPDNLFNSFRSTDETATFYIKEISSEYGSVRPGVWKVTMAGSSDTTGKGSTITSAVYYTSNANCASNTGGVAIQNESGHSGAWYIQGDRTAFYDQSTSTTYANYEMVNRVEYYYSLALLKYDDKGNIISGASIPAKYRVDTAPSGGTNISTKDVNSTSPVTMFENIKRDTDTATFYVSESQAASYTSKRGGYWEVQMKGSPKSGTASTIINAIYHAANGNTYTLGTSSTTAAQGWITNKNSTAAITVLNLPNDSLKDIWVTWDLDKVQTGTTTRVAGAGYVVVPLNQSSFRYSGTPGSTSYDRYLGDQTFNNAMTTLGNGNWNVRYNGKQYTSAASLFQAIGAYTNKNASSAEDAAKMFMDELGKVSNADGNVFFRNQTYMKNSEFGYYVTTASGAASMYRMYSNNNGVVSRTTEQQYFLLADNTPDPSASRDFIVVEVYAPSGYIYPANAAYKTIRVTSNQLVDSKSNEGNSTGKLLVPSSYSLNKSNFYPSRVTDLQDAALTSPYTWNSSSTLHALRGNDVKTTTHTVEKNGTAVTDGTITSIQAELRTSGGQKVTTNAHGDAITNPVTLSNSAGWIYTWTELNPSTTYTVVETSVTYKDGSGATHTATAGSNPSINTLFATSTVTGTTSTGSKTTLTNNNRTLTGGLGVMKVFTAADGTEHRASGVTFGVYSNSACTSLVTTLTTNNQGLAEYTIPEWNYAAGTTKTFYIKETGNANAKDASTGARLSLLPPDNTVIKVVVTGAAAATGSSAVYTNNANNTAATSVKNGTYYLYYYKATNTTTELFGQFKFEKTDFRNQPQVVSFDVYTNSSLTNKVSTKEVTLSGGKATISWTVAELENNAKWPSDASHTKTYYVRENEASVPTGYNWNSTVYTVVVTGAADIANSTFTVNGSAVADSYKVVNTSSEFEGALGIYKWGYVGQTEKAIEGVVFTVYRDAACTQAYATLTTNANGYATKVITDYPGVNDGWHECDGTTQTFYLKETDITNAEIDGAHVDLVASDLVIKAVVNGRVKTSTAAYSTDYTVQSGSGSIANGTYNGTPAVGIVEVENTVISSKGALGIYKTDNNGRKVEGLQFDIYAGNSNVNTADPLTSITTNADGLAFLEVSTMTDGVVAAGSGIWQEGETKTFLIRENKESAEAHNLVWDSTVVTAVVTAVDKNATAYQTTYSVPSSSATFNNATLAVMNQVNTATTSHTAIKTFGGTRTENATQEVWATLYDSQGKVVTTDADGKAITNPVNLMAQNGYSYTWTRLVEDLNNPYHAVETKVVLTQYAFTTNGQITTETVTLDTAEKINEFYTNTATTANGTTTISNTLKKYYYTVSASKVSLKEENGNITISDAAADATGAKVSVGRGIDLTTGALTDVIAANIEIPAGYANANTLFAGFASGNATETFYIIETTPAGKNYIADGYWTVTMNGVMGVDSSASQITEVKYYTTRNAAAQAVAVGTEADAEALMQSHALYKTGTVSYLLTIANEYYKPLYGAFGLIKTDELGNVVEKSFSFDVYGKSAFNNGSLTGSALATLTTTNGYAMMDVSAVSDGTVPAGAWIAEESGNTKTFYLKETNAPGEYVQSDVIIRVIVTGNNKPESAAVSYALYQNGAWNELTASGSITRAEIASATRTPNSAITLSDETVGYKTAGMDAVIYPNSKKKAAEVTKTWFENPYADGLVESIEVTLYDQDDNVVTTDAYGNNITNPVSITDGNEFYRWKDLSFSDGTKELIYTAKETAIILKDGTRITGAAIAEYMIVAEDEAESRKDITGMGEVSVSESTIENTSLTWNNYFGLLKDDGVNGGVQATFGIYTDEACTNKVAELATTSTDKEATYNPGTWWQKDGAKTFYIREISNDGKHVIFPWTIKVTLTGVTRGYDLITGSKTAEEVAKINQQIGFTGLTEAEQNAALVYVPNKPIELHISKLDITNDNEVPGAELKVYVYDDTKEDHKGDEYASWTSTDQTYVLDNVPTGKYVLSEVTAPTDHGYVTASDIEFEVVDSQIVNTVTMYDERTELHISKRDFTDGSDVPGAVLELTDANNQPVITWTTGDDTSITVGTDYAANGLEAKAGKDDNDEWILVINYIPVGDYTLTETTAPNGYLRAESIPVTVTDSSIISTVEMKDKRKVIVSKIDQDTDEAIPDVTMTIYKYDENAEEHKGDIAFQWITTPNRNTAIPGMAPGKYVLEETVTANGYNTAADIEFEVDANQDTEVHITMYDKPFTTTISKTDITTGEKVIGAHLSVTTNQDITFEGNDYSAGDVIKEWDTTDQDVTIDYIPEGSYTLTEVLPPDEWGYVTANEIDFEIISDKTANGGERTKVETKVEMKDDYTKVKLCKVNEYGEMIEGAKLEIRKATENGYEDKAFKYSLPDGTAVECAYTSTTTAIDVLYLPFGDYYLVEAESPDGYFTAEPKKFTVGDSAEVVSVTLTNSRLSALPSTGSMSDFLMKVSGLFMILLGAFAVLIGQLRRKKIEA